jgi:photosystem II stability/assembly factor-like uncharacterized protein
MVTAIAVNPNDASTIYVGTAGGGVWKTRDGGTSWRALFDRQLAMGIGEPMGVAIDPNDTDTIYVGTSGRARVSPQRQAGLFKSTDGGASWARLGAPYPPETTATPACSPASRSTPSSSTPRTRGRCSSPRRAVSSDPPTGGETGL